MLGGILGMGLHGRKHFHLSLNPLEQVPGHSDPQANMVVVVVLGKDLTVSAKVGPQFTVARMELDFRFDVTMAKGGDDHRTKPIQPFSRMRTNRDGIGMERFEVIENRSVLHFVDLVEHEDRRLVACSDLLQDFDHCVVVSDRARVGGIDDMQQQIRLYRLFQRRLE